MKRCVNQAHVVPTATGKYSECVDDLVASSSATLLAMNDRIAPPQRRSFTPPAGRVYPFRSASCATDSMRSPLGSRTDGAQSRRSSSKVA